MQFTRQSNHFMSFDHAHFMVRIASNIFKIDKIVALLAHRSAAARRLGESRRLPSHFVFCSAHHSTCASPPREVFPLRTSGSQQGLPRIVTDFRSFLMVCDGLSHQVKCPKILSFPSGFLQKLFSASIPYRHCFIMFHHESSTSYTRPTWFLAFLSLAVRKLYICEQAGNQSWRCLVLRAFHLTSKSSCVRKT